MKKQIILGLGFYFVCCISAFAYYGYNSYQPYRSTINRNYYNQSHYYMPYNNIHYPYCRNSYYINPYYNPYNVNVSRIKQKRRMKKIQRKMKNQISWLKNNNNGNLTGYSVPVQKNILNNFDPQNQKNLLSSPTCNTDLWGNGNGNGGNYYKFSSFGKYNDDSKAGAKTGVTIIYD